MFQDRREAGRVLAASLLKQSAIASEPVVLGLPRGGVPVAFEVAAQFRAPLDVCIVQRLEVPGSSGAVMGALASGRALVLLRSIIDEFGVSESTVDRVVKKERLALHRRERAYRGEKSPIPLAGRIVVLVDDGLASIAVPIAAITAIRTQKPERVVLATPVARAESHEFLVGVVDELVCLEVPKPFRAVHTCYKHFPEVTDLEVRQLHAEASVRVKHWSFPN